MDKERESEETGQDALYDFILEQEKKIYRKYFQNTAADFVKVVTDPRNGKKIDTNTLIFDVYVNRPVVFILASTFELRECSTDGSPVCRTK